MQINRFLTRRDVLAGAALGGATLLGAPGRLLAQAGAPAEPLDDLRALLRGPLLTPADAGYDDARQLFNAMIDRRPSAIAPCTGAADVMAVVDFARDRNLAVTVRGGGHSVSGRALRDGAIAIDLAPMRGTWVNREARTVRAEGGLTWGELDRETLAFDLVTTGGTISSTGIGGLTLGGGLGWLMRKHGLACDNVVSAEIVTADGELVTASATENADLYWAIRGGGGNFGVVTSFEFGLHALEPITGGLALYPQDAVGDVLRFFREFTASAPDSVTTMAGVIGGPPDTPVAGQSAGWIGVCHKGPADEGERLLRPIKTFGPPALDLIGPMPYTALQTMFDAGSGQTGYRHYWRSNFLAELSDAVIDEILARAVPLRNPSAAVLLEHMGGAVARVGATETAFSNRSARYNATILNKWDDPATDAANARWTRDFGDAVRAHATGAGYVNYMTDDESAARVRATYESNYARLVAVKRRYDPTNFWSGNQNIAP